MSDLWNRGDLSTWDDPANKSRYGGDTSFLINVAQRHSAVLLATGAVSQDEIDALVLAAGADPADPASWTFDAAWDVLAGQEVMRRRLVKRGVVIGAAIEVAS